MERHSGGANGPCPRRWRWAAAAAWWRANRPGCNWMTLSRWRMCRWTSPRRTLSGLSGPAVNQGQFQFNWASTPDARYRISSRSSFHVPWSQVATGVVATPPEEHLSIRVYLRSTSRCTLATSLGRHWTSRHAGGRRLTEQAVPRHRSNLRKALDLIAAIRSGKSLKSVKAEVVAKAKQLMQAGRVNDLNWPLLKNSRRTAAAKASTEQDRP